MILFVLSPVCVFIAVLLSESSTGVTKLNKILLIHPWSEIHFVQSDIMNVDFLVLRTTNIPPDCLDYLTLTLLSFQAEVSVSLLNIALCNGWTKCE